MQDEAPAPAETGAGSGGFNFSLEGWTVADLVAQATEHRLYLLAAVSVLVFLFLWVADVPRPGAMAKNARDVKPLPSAVWLFAGLMVLATTAFSAVILREQAWVTGPDPAGFRGVAGITSAAFGVSALVALGMVYLFARSAPKAGLIPGVLDLPIGLICLAIAAPVVMLSGDLAVIIYERTMETAAAPIAHDTLNLILDNRSSPWVWGLIAGAVVGAPIVEEVIYRVFFQSAVLRWTGSPWAAIFGATALFTAMHAVGPKPVPFYALVPIGVLGLAMGIAYERTRRIGVPIVMHMGFNAANILLAMRLEG